MAGFKGNNLIKGTVKGNPKGYAFLICDDENLPDCFIPRTGLHGAMHGDKVVAKVTNDKGGDRIEVSVVKIVERGVKELVGTFQPFRSGGFVIPDDKNYFCDVFAENGNTKNAKKGDKVIIKITRYLKDKKNPEGVITKVIGKGNDRFTETKCILIANGIETEFNKRVISEADSVGKPVSKKQKRGRTDFTGDVVVTIDGESARDFDDAVSVTALNDGNYKLCVHIADVSEYVRRFGELDKEAFKRGNSTYLPESVVPMLPPTLCDDICSLKQGVERLTLSCVMTINGNGEVVDKDIAEGVIKSKARMTYTKVYGILSGDEKLCEDYREITPMLKDAFSLYKILKRKRELRGSVNLDTKDAEIEVVGGKVEVKPFVRNFAHEMIEEFMICANECVAEYAYFLDAPFVYRTHDKPSAEKTEKLRTFLAELGYNVKWKEDNVHSKDYSNVLKKYENTELYGLVSRVVLRSMQKAVYCEKDIGHFGLSSEHYCHFTSPIRRYADLTVHRIIKDVLHGNGDRIWDIYGNSVAGIAKQCSENEIKSELAERQADEYYKMLYLKDRIHREFDGIISGVTDFGVFVELENTCEGLVRIENLPYGNYVFDEKRMVLKNNYLEFKLGRRVVVGVVAVDLSSKKAEFIMLDAEDGCKKRKKGI